MDHLREAIAEVLAENIEFAPGTFITVLKAKLTRNGAHASALLSIMPTDAKEAVLLILNDERHVIKDELAKKLSLRRIPSIFWSFDDTESEAAKIDTLINELKRKGEL